MWPRGPDHPHDVATTAELDELLNDAPCWDEADQRFLVLWGHGERAFPTPSARLPRYPRPSEVVDALAGHRSPDIIGYDACWMATVHTVITLANAMTDRRVHRLDGPRAGQRMALRRAGPDPVRAG